MPLYYGYFLAAKAAPQEGPRAGWVEEQKIHPFAVHARDGDEANHAAAETAEEVYPQIEGFRHEYLLSELPPSVLLEAAAEAVAGQPGGALCAANIQRVMEAMRGTPS